jgi:hypothetical protein
MSCFSPTFVKLLAYSEHHTIACIHKSLKVLTSLSFPCIFRLDKFACIFTLLAFSVFAYSALKTIIGCVVRFQLTWADVGFFAVSGWVSKISEGAVLPKYPKLNALVGRVETVPKVAEWLAKRPVTEF